MTGQPASHGPAHFQRLYDANPDPWQYRSSPYERAKYQRTLSVLGDRRFRSGFEPACSIGVLTAMLADRCGQLLATDLLETPLEAAREACASKPWVRFEQMRIPEQWPHAQFDLIVLSEVLYFLVPADIQATARQTIATLAPDGMVLLVNWRGQNNDPTNGDQAATIFMQATERWLAPQTQYQEDAYRLDLLRRR